LENVSKLRYKVLSHVSWRPDLYITLTAGDIALAVFIERPRICWTIVHLLPLFLPRLIIIFI